VKKDLVRGSAVVGKEERPVKQVARKTEAGKEKQAETEKSRLKYEAMLKANLKEDEEDDIEANYPHVKLEELLDDLKIEDDEEEKE